MPDVDQSKSGLFESLTNAFVRPVFVRLVGEGAIRSQLLRFLLALIVVPFALIVVTSILLPEIDRLTAYSLTLFVVMFFGVLGFVDRRRETTDNESMFAEHHLLVEVFEDPAHLDRAEDVEIIVRGAISGEKDTKSGEFSWSYGNYQISREVKVTARRGQQISETYILNLEKNTTKLVMSFEEKQSPMRAIQASRKPPFFRSRGTK